jgi:hypothetical protein
MLASFQESFRRAAAVLGLVLLTLGSVGCAAAPPSLPVEPPGGFLGDYSELRKLEGSRAHLAYIDPDAVWSDYDAVQIESVSIWVHDASAQRRVLDDTERQHLTDTMYRALHDELARTFRIADGAGPGVLRLRVALTEAKGARTPLGVMTAAAPERRLVAGEAKLDRAIADVVDSATIEAELRDTITGVRLAAAVDWRAGRSSRREFETWSDVEAAATHWAQRLEHFLVRQGVRRR